MVFPFFRGSLERVEREKERGRKKITFLKGIKTALIFVSNLRFQRERKRERTRRTDNERERDNKKLIGSTNESAISFGKRERVFL